MKDEFDLLILIGSLSSLPGERSGGKLDTDAFFGLSRQPSSDHGAITWHINRTTRIDLHFTSVAFTILAPA
jgi:hypothetical protein